MRVLQELRYILVANKRLMLTYLFLFPVILFGLVIGEAKLFDFYNIKYSRSDLILLSVTNIFSLILFSIIIVYNIMFLLRCDFMTVVIIRQRSKRSIWFHQAGKAAVLSFFFAFYSTLFLALFSFIFSSIDNNWDDYGSVFSYTMHFELDHSISLPVVIALFFVFLFLFFLVMTLLYLLVKWSFRSEAIGCIVVIVYLLYCSTDCSFLNYIATCAIQYGDFADPARLLWPLLAPLLWIGVLLGAGALLANRAEFYSAGKK